MKRPWYLLLSIPVILTIGLYFFARGLWYPYYVTMTGKRSTAEAIAEVGDQTRDRLRVRFGEHHYPPTELALIATKDDQRLRVWGRDAGPWYFVTDYDIKAASGHPGPKLREGDRQVPEGIYRITGFNPNSSYHLSMKLNYPNAFDLAQARRDQRSSPGSNIFIHGKAVSIGCLAMGDAAIEDLFVLVHDVGRDKVQVIIAPNDPRTQPLRPPPGSAPWVAGLYRQIEKQLAAIYRP